MSVTRLRWLLAVVIIELLIIIGLIIWVMVRPDSQTTTETQTTSSGSGMLTPSLLATGLEAPTNIVTTPDKADQRLFVTQRNGAIMAVSKENGKSTLFLDITSKAKDNGGEMGLLGLAFHSKFADNGFFYVNYTDKEDNTIIARYQTKADGTTDPTTEKVLIKLKQPYENHNGGALAFGPDGFLYIALGDGGSGGDPQNYAQSKNTLLGKILRIDVDSGDPYTVPASNPFISESGSKPEIWAYGLRNPWRMTFDRETGDLYIADVGQNKVEEVNVQKAGKGGQNYGWRCYEGTAAYNTEGCKDPSTYTMPAFQYEQGDGRKAVVGGYVYHGKQMTSLTGAYLFGDTYSGEILEARQAPNGSWNQKTLLKTPYIISTFGQDQDGELYIADLQSGSIYKLQTH